MLARYICLGIFRFRLSWRKSLGEMGLGPSLWRRWRLLRKFCLLGLQLSDRPGFEIILKRVWLDIETSLHLTWRRGRRRWRRTKDHTSISRVTEHSTVWHCMGHWMATSIGGWPGGTLQKWLLLLLRFMTQSCAAI